MLFFNTYLKKLRILDISLVKNIYFMKQLSKTTLVYILTFFITGFLFADKVEPPKDSVPFRGSHYKAFLDTNSTWWEAKFACDDIGGELVVISSAPENEFVRRMAKDNLVWLGGTDEFEEGKWTWDNGEPFKFKHWDENQPAGTNGFNFLILNGKNGKWADTTDFSGKVKGYICEWKGSAPKNAGPKDSELKPPAK